MQLAARGLEAQSFLGALPEHRELQLAEWFQTPRSVRRARGFCWSLYIQQLRKIFAGGTVVDILGDLSGDLAQEIGAKCR